MLPRPERTLLKEKFWQLLNILYEKKEKKSADICIKALSVIQLTLIQLVKRNDYMILFTLFPHELITRPPC